MTPSKYQQAILNEVKSTKNNIGIKAVAGSGKSTTLRLICEVVPPQQSVLACAFNKDAATALQAKVAHLINVTSKTLNGFGHGIVTRAFKCKLDANKTDLIFRKYKNPDDRSEKNDYYQWRNPIKRLVSLFKGAILPPYEATPANINQFADNFGIDLPDKDSPSFCYYLTRVYKECVETTSIIDFDDQLFFPIFYKLPIPQYDVVVIDECQDLNAVQIELVIRAGTRIVACGDPRQAIYGFRGACADAYNQLMERINATQLPLSVSYRCPRSVVKQAQSIVSDIESCETADEGSVENIKYDAFTKKNEEGDYVLCRTTAPLVSGCLSAIRGGKRATVLGRDIADQLVALVKKVSVNDDQEVENFWESVLDYQSKEIHRLNRTENENAIQALTDKVDTIKVFVESDGIKVVRDIITRIDSIFSEKRVGIIFSTVHKAKGLESDNVFILEPQLMPMPPRKGKVQKDWQREQEMNIKYVAITRAKKNLYWVSKA